MMACAAAEPYVAKLEDALEAKLENAFDYTMHSDGGSKPSPKVSNIVYIYT